MAARNHSGPFGVALGGVRIVSDAVGKPGTLGCLATDGAGGGGFYLVSNYHVLCSDPIAWPPPANANIFQPDPNKLNGAGAYPVLATLDPTRADPHLDCAAALLVLPGVAFEPRILGIGRVTAYDPQWLKKGEAVIKSGAGTGVTEGVITAVNGVDITIEAAPEFPHLPDQPEYDISGPGDSGALWVHRDTRAALALHAAGSAAAGGVVQAIDIDAVLHALRLTLLV